MPQSYIRIARTPDVRKAISDLQARYSLLSEAEIIKLALSETHNRSEQKLREKFNHAIEEGGKIGDKLLAKKGLKRENMTEQQIYDIFLDTHKHKT